MTKSDSLKAGGTDDLIRALGSEAGRSRPGSFWLALPAGSVLALLAAFAVVFLVIGPRADLEAIATTWTFLFKVVAMVLLALAGIREVRAAAIPGSASRPLAALLPAILFLTAGALLDRSGFPLLGARALSVPYCVGAILLASLPALTVIFAAVKSGIPTRPARAGAMAGLLAGALGALAYTVACVNDGAGFVALWYSLAVGLVAALGAVVGRRILSW